jgi:RNA polymerase sigma-70 factor (sigma-E family)
MRGSDSLHRLAGWVGDLDEHDLATFTTFIAGARGRLHRAAYRLCGDWHLADDLVQESVLALYRQWSRLDRDQDPYPYIHQTLVNMAWREHLRAWRRHENRQDPPEVALNKEGLIETRLAVLRALARLGPRQRAIVVLRYYEDLDVQQTATAMRCSPGTVRSQSSRALHTLRDLLSPAFHPRDRD